MAESLSALAVSAFLGAHVLRMNPRGSPHRAFFVLMMIFVGWDACEAIGRALPAGTSAAAVYPWIQGEWLGIAAVPAALMHLGLTYPETSPWLRHRLALPLVYAPVAAWAVLIFGTDLLIQGAAANFFGPSAEIGTAYLLLALLYSAWFYVSVALFVAAWWRLRKGSLRQMQGVVVLGLLLGTAPAGVTEIFWPFLSDTNTRLGLASVYTLLWSIFLAVAIARYRYLVIEPVTEAKAAAQAKHPVERGMNYLVLEPGRSAAMGAFRELVSTTPGICVTGLSPTRVAARFGLERTPVLWITSVSAGGRTVRPEGLDFELVHTVLKFLRENPGTAVLLDDLDYLATIDGFDAVARFLKRVANQASTSQGTLIATASPGTFTPEQLAVLGGSADEVLDLSDSANGVVALPGQSVLLFVAAQDVPVALAEAGARTGLVLTTEHPSKARRRYGPEYELLWLAEHPDPRAPSARLAALDTEARRAVLAYVGSHAHGDVVLAGLEQIALFVDFPTLLAFVKDTLDLVGLHGGRVLATVAPSGLPPRELAMLARRFDVPLAAAALRGSPAGGLPTASPGSRTPSRARVS